MTFLRAIPCPVVSPRRSVSAKIEALAKEDAPCGPHFCSMKITEDVRKFAAEQEISDDQVLQVDLEQKAKEFIKKGAEVYAKT